MSEDEPTVAPVPVDLSRYTVAQSGRRVVLICRRCVGSGCPDLASSAHTMDVERITDLIRDHETEVHG